MSAPPGEGGEGEGGWRVEGGVVAATNDVECMYKDSPLLGQSLPEARSHHFAWRPRLIVCLLTRPLFLGRLRSHDGGGCGFTRKRAYRRHACMHMCKQTFRPLTAPPRLSMSTTPSSPLPSASSSSVLS